MENQPCRLCQSATEPYLDLNKWFLRRCESCGFVQVDHRPTPEELRSLYSGAYFSKQKYTDSRSITWEYDRRLALLEQFLPSKASRLLDAGCATGDFVKVAKSRFEVWGHDISDEAIEEAKRANPEIEGQFRSGMLEEANFPEDYFDGIALWDVIEHLWDPKETCEQLLKAIKPGGYLFLSTPNIGAMNARVAGKRWAFMTVPEHLSFFSKKTMQSLFEKQLGAKVVHFGSHGKWVSLGFLAYKLNRVVPGKLTEQFKKVTSGKLSPLPIYVPTGDVAYAVIRK